MVRLRIKEAATDKGLNQLQLQKLSGVTPQLLNRYWRNHTESAAFVPLSKIAKALGVKAGDLIEDDDLPNCREDKSA